MLVQFTVENFLSFEKETTFSMVASHDDAHPSHVIRAPQQARGGDLVRAAAIYGANASGKSNLIKAMQFARDRIVNGARPGQRIPVTPFRLSAAREQPSKFQFLFRLADGTLYDYGFVLDDRRIHEEWLFGTPARKNAKEQRYFERTTDVAGATTVEFGEALTGKAAREKQRFEFLVEGTRMNQLFMTECVEHNIGKVERLAFWLQGVNFLGADETILSSTASRYSFTDRIAWVMLPLLKAAGVGIESFEVVERKLTPDKIASILPPLALSELLVRIRDGNSGELWMTAQSGEQLLLRISDSGDIEQITFNLLRRDDSGAIVAFEPKEESDGTQRLLRLFSPLIALWFTDTTVIIDELDRRLHTLISQMFVTLSFDSVKSVRSQLIFTTHDTNLLDLDLLRRDEIWFVEKDERGASHLSSLAEFKVRPDLKVEKGYLQGRFGAIPYIGDLSRLLPKAEGEGSDTASTEPAPAAAGG